MTLFTGHKSIYLEETGSTNSYLQELVKKEKLPEGTVVCTAYQTRGRGQQGARWKSTKGSNILCSVLLYPDFLKANEQFLISQCVALGVRNCLAAHLPEEEVLIKWPNDILVSGKKISGILIENSLQGNAINYTIAGIGINVNQQADPELPQMTSLGALCRKEFDLEDVKRRLWSHIEAMYLQLRSGKREKIKTEYLKRLYGYAQPLPFIESASGLSFEGIIRGTDPSGRLLIENSSGAVKAYDIKAIQFLY